MDNQAYYEQSDLLERDMMRPKLPRNFGWKVAFVLAKDWYEDQAAVLDRLWRLLEGGDEPDEEKDLARDEELLEEDAENESQADEIFDLDLSEESMEPASAVPPDEVSQPQVELPEMVDDDHDTSPAMTTALTSEGHTRHFECSSDKSNKFWEITLSGNEHTVRFGRIGTNGQTKTKQFSDAAQARRDCERLVRSKLAKGYREK